MALSMFGATFTILASCTPLTAFRSRVEAFEAVAPALFSPGRTRQARTCRVFVKTLICVISAFVTTHDLELSWIVGDHNDAALQKCYFHTVLCAGTLDP